jgi:hypothetical protein
VAVPYSKDRAVLLPLKMVRGTGVRLAKPTRTRYGLASLPIRVVHLSGLLVVQQTLQFRLFSTI